MRRGENEQGIPRRDQIVEHDTEAAAVAALAMADRGWLGDVEGAESTKCRELPGGLRWNDREDEQEGDHLVPHHAAMIGDPEMAAR